MIQEFWLSQQFTHEKIYKYTGKEIPAIMRMKEQLEQQHKLPEGSLDVGHQWNGAQKRILLPSGVQVPVDAYFYELNVVYNFQGNFCLTFLSAWL